MRSPGIEALTVGAGTAASHTDPALLAAHASTLSALEMIPVRIRAHLSAAESASHTSVVSFAKNAAQPRLPGGSAVVGSGGDCVRWGGGQIAVVFSDVDVMVASMFGRAECLRRLPRRWEMEYVPRDSQAESRVEIESLIVNVPDALNIGE